MSRPSVDDALQNQAYVAYRSNNSGGNWWLEDSDWRALEAAGWVVEWEKKGRWLGALATSAERYGLSLKDAAEEFVRITGADLSDEGCNCCGRPHDFTEYGPDGRYLRSIDIERNNSWVVSE